MTSVSSVPKTTSPVEPRRHARKAGLRYVIDTAPGITRVGRGKVFTYRRVSGKAVRDETTLRRIRSLVIPPAWMRVWICPLSNGHIQATGRDDRGRKQYRYHPKWTETREQHKYDHVIAFGRVLPGLRRQVKHDLLRKGLPREKVLAAVVRLLETTLIRIGNDEYARDNHSYGLTTMRNRHVHVRGKNIEFDFRGKSGKQHHIELADPRLAKIVRQCQDLPGQDLFAYRDEACEVRSISSQDVNDYLRAQTSEEFTAKDFRTWSGTVLAALAFQEFQDVTNAVQAKRNVKTVVESVSKILGNTPSVCRKCYIHPEIINAYLEGTALNVVSQRIGENLNGSVRKLRPVEAAVLALLQKRLKSRGAGISK
jgi:DNA topoisomerase I